MIKLREITDPGTPEEKIEDTPIIDVLLDVRDSVPTIIKYQCVEFPDEWIPVILGNRRTTTWVKIDGSSLWEENEPRKTRAVLVIDGKEYDEVQVKEHYAELKLLFDRMHTEKLLEEIGND